jgi:uncharacterized iron-regulated membrane protein
MEIVVAFIAAMGVPTAITGLLVWWLKRHLDKKETARERKEENTEKLMLMIMQNGRAAVVLAEATARAVQRIPDAHCNGDMKTALERAEKIQKEEQDFLLDQGVQHIFGNN